MHLNMLKNALQAKVTENLSLKKLDSTLSINFMASISSGQLAMFKITSIST